MFDSRFNNFSVGGANNTGATRSTDTVPPSGSPSTTLSGDSVLPLENPLSAFSSYSCVFTLGILTKEQVSFPDSTYRAGESYRTILRSGGTGNTQVRTKYEKELGITGEYFIDDVTVDTIIAPTGKTRLTNATNLNFTVKEPYSMGLFLQTLALAAADAGHRNYAKAPYLLTIEFIGFDDNGTVVTVPNTKRYFPFSFTNVSFNVTAGGSVYNVEGIPWNELAFADEVQTTQEDLDLKGETVADLLQIGDQGNESLSYLLNRKEKAEEDGESKISANKYVIQFPVEKSSADQNMFADPDRTGAATTNADTPASSRTPEANPVTLENIQNFAENSANINEIGQASITQSAWEGGSQAFGRPEFKEENPGVFKRENITIKEKQRRLEFKKGTRIQEIIEEIVLLSEYGKKLVDQKETDELGMKDWFRIETEVYPITDNQTELQRGEMAKVFVFKIVPYKYNAIATSKVTAETPGLKGLKANAVKKYDYIYSGQNDDILDFTLEFNTAFYQNLQFDLGQLTQSQKEGAAGAQTQQEESSVNRVPEGNSNQASNDKIEATASVGQHAQGNGGEVAGTTVSPETKIARMFNEAIVSGVDLISVQLQVLGDPYYIADSGQGNYTARTSAASPNITKDGSIDYQNSEVDVILNFKTPIDIGDDGFMAFPVNDAEPVAQFSGVYKVLTVQNSFSSNKFTQSLELIRRRNQNGNETTQDGAVEEGTEENRILPVGINDVQRRGG